MQKDFIQIWLGLNTVPATVWFHNILYLGYCYVKTYVKSTEWSTIGLSDIALFCYLWKRAHCKRSGIFLEVHCQKLFSSAGKNHKDHKNEFCRENCLSPVIQGTWEARTVGWLEEEGTQSCKDRSTRVRVLAGDPLTLPDLVLYNCNCIVYALENPIKI